MNGFFQIFFLRSWAKIHLPLIHLLISLPVYGAQQTVLIVISPVAPIEAGNPTRTLQQDSTRINALLTLFRDNVNKDIVAAEQHAEAALLLSEKLKYSKGLIESYCALADIHRLRGNYDRGEALICQGIALSEDTGDQIRLAKCYLSMFSLQFGRGNYAEAAEWNEQSHAIGERLGSEEILAPVYGNLGITKGVNGQHIQAVEYFLKSMEMFRSRGDDHQVGLTMMRIGHTFELAGSYDKALDYLYKALEIHRALRQWSSAGWSLLNIGVTHSRVDPENHSLKRDYYREALEMAERAGDFRLKLACLDNIGGSYSLSGEYRNANLYLRKAYKLSQDAGHNSRTVFITGNLAENYLYTGQLDSALLFSEENLRISIREKNTFEKRQAYSVLSRIYAARNENRKAYEMLLRHTSLSDSVFNVQKSQQIEDLREKYETEKKEQEIELLTREKTAAVFRKNTFALLSVLLLVVGFLVFAVLRMRVRRNQLLLDKEIELDRMKSRFFSNISHEFRTPLTLILGPIDDLITRPENAGIQKHLKTMRRNGGRLLELVNQLLELSRIEAGRLKPALTKNNVVSLAKGIGMSFDSLAEMKNIRLEVFSGADAIEIYIDHDKFEKILTNLLSNAFKFTPENGLISVHIHTTRQARLPGLRECLEVVVKDSGRGIPQEEIMHIFDRFYQADNNQLLQQEGSGIGLALTRELVELHRGAIWASCAVAGGTEIRLQIPLNLEEILTGCIAEMVSAPSTLQTDVNGEAEPVDAPEAGSDSHRPIVLLIEDNIDVRIYVRDILEDHYQVVEASDGDAGIEMALDTIPDLILSDVMMPRSSGHEVCLALKNSEKTSHIPIILLTAKADVESRIEGLETKADDYLTKPFIPKELLLRIQNLIESRRKMREKYLGTLTLRPGDISVKSVDEKFLKKLMDRLEVHMGDEKFGVEELGTEIGMSRSQLHRKLKALTGQGPNQFIRTFRLNRAHDLLKVNAATAAEIAYTVGFNSPSYFTKCFHEHFGYTPSDIGTQ